MPKPKINDTEQDKIARFERIQKAITALEKQQTQILRQGEFAPPGAWVARYQGEHPEFVNSHFLPPLIPPCEGGKLDIRPLARSLSKSTDTSDFICIYLCSSVVLNPKQGFGAFPGGRNPYEKSSELMITEPAL